jgi:hypothetical protein
MVFLAGVATDATAATVDRTIMQLAPGVCGANNPVNDPSLRRLPTGLKNATTVNVSVVCNMWGDDATAAVMGYVFVYFKNEKTTSSSVTCTLSAGVPVYGQTTSTKSMTLAAGAVNFLAWNSADYGTDVNTQWVNLQCSVPAGWSMRELGVVYSENVGS